MSPFLKSPMPGTVVSVAVSIGDTVCQRISNDCRKSDVKVITLTNLNRSKQRHEVIRMQAETVPFKAELVWLGKWFYISIFTKPLCSTLKKCCWFYIELNFLLYASGSWRTGISCSWSYEDAKQLTCWSFWHGKIFHRNLKAPWKCQVLQSKSFPRCWLFIVIRKLTVHIFSRLKQCTSRLATK